MKPLLLAACALAIALSSCVENEEDIAIRSDGSSSVRLSAKGKARDLDDGYVLPLGAPWTAVNADTAEWIRLFGQAAGNPDPVVGSHELIEGDRELTLAVQADFASVKDWPRWFAPESDVYRSAYLERSASLKIESKSGRRVFTFERVFQGREFERFDVMAQLKKNLPDEMRQKLEKDPEFSPEERVKLVHAAVAAMRSTSSAFLRDALACVYTSGDASLSASSGRAVEAFVQAKIAEVVSEARLREVLDFEIPLEPRTDNAFDDERSAKTLETDIRATLRSALAAALARENVPAPTQNAIRGQLEWSLTAYDHTVDIGDESFEVTVHMPGVIISGNADEVSGDTAKWKFEGAALQDRQRTLRVVSVLE